MAQLILCREYPPAPYPAGGIGTYVRHIARLLAEAGETVHVIAQRWDGAPSRVSESLGGRLIVHRISLDEPVGPAPGQKSGEKKTLRRLASSTCPSQLFSWQAARYAESLIEDEPIDLIEGQEWEAPLYYLQVRRALGLGPRREPPCLVHLHSPSQLIFRHNEWDETLTDFLPLSRLEEYTVKAADSLICPSRYLASQAAELFGVDRRDVEVVPYPMGDTPVIEREPDVWVRDSICYVGRLELRKGMIEWVDAAVRVASSHSGVSFDFIGSDTSLSGGVGGSVLEFLKARIPPSLHRRFRFHGGQSRGGLLGFLGRTAMLAVPSRWENLPFTCIEAMSTGLPVLVSPHGGMTELITDGESGWVARDGTAAGLESAIWQALKTPPAERQAMGRRASHAVRRICGNELILGRHLELRGRVARAGAVKSRMVPGHRLAGPVRDIGRRDIGRRGVGISVTCMDHPERMAGCMESILNQGISATTSVVVAGRFRVRHGAMIDSLAKDQRASISVLYTSDDSPDAAMRLGVDTLIASTPGLRAIITLCQDVRLEPGYASACECVFERQADVGLVSPWVLRQGANDDLDPGPSPILLSRIAQPDVPPGAAVRVEVLLIAQDSERGIEPQTVWDVLAKGGWSAVTYPGLAISLLPPTSRGEGMSTLLEKRYSVMALAQSGSDRLALQWFLAAPWAEKVRWVRSAISQPQRMLRRIGWECRRAVAGFVAGPSL